MDGEVLEPQTLEVRPERKGDVPERKGDVDQRGPGGIFF